MSENNYQKHEWQEGELITSAGLNHIEEGIKEAHIKANKQVEEIINDNNLILEEISNKLKDFLVEIDEEEETLIFKITNNENT